MLKIDDKVTYCGLPFNIYAKVYNDMDVWEARNERGEIVIAPASAFVPVEEPAKARRWLGNMEYLPSIKIPIVDYGEGPCLDTARIAAPVVLERLKEIVGSTGVDTLCNLDNAIAALEKEVNDE